MIGGLPRIDGGALREARALAPQEPVRELLQQRPPVGPEGLRGGVEVRPVFVAESDGAVRTSRLVGHPANPVRCTYSFQCDLLAVYVHPAYSGVRTPTSGEMAMANKTSEFDAIVNDMVARHGAHTLHQRSEGTSYRPQISTACSCGWRSEVSDNLRPQWAAIDKHLIDDVLPQWQSDVCWCGRAMLLGPLGKWFHAQPGTHGHDAAPRKAS